MTLASSQGVDASLSVYFDPSYSSRCSANPNTPYYSALTFTGTGTASFGANGSPIAGQTVTVFFGSAPVTSFTVTLGGGGTTCAQSSDTKLSTSSAFVTQISYIVVMGMFLATVLVLLS